MTQHFLGLLCGLDCEHSKGTISLQSGNPATQPSIRLNYLAEPADLRRIMHNVRLACELLSSSHFRKLGAKRVAPNDGVLTSDQSLEAWIRGNLATAFHTSSGAPMGPPSDPMAVVDQECRVLGIDNLRVIDLSITPRIISRGPNATAVMIGERAAEFFA
jgi:choline dehydrogenase-like flavoprotein